MIQRQTSTKQHHLVIQKYFDPQIVKILFITGNGLVLGISRCVTVIIHGVKNYRGCIKEVLQILRNGFMVKKKKSVMTGFLNVSIFKYLQFCVFQKKLFSKLLIRYYCLT